MSASGFISKAACRGYRPSRFSSYNGRQRPHLIARLAKERSIARFIVAPDGYGKTCLAIDYAETMFAWAHVFWLVAQSPCFLRDLDAGILSEACFQVNAEAKLVVIDDLPQLDAQRAERLSRELDAFLSRGCEVVVTCTPSCDLLGGLQIDRLRIGAAELLLSDEELDATRHADERDRKPAVLVPASERVPALAWGSSPADVAAFASGCVGECMPADLLLVTCSAFALVKGTVADLASIGPIDPNVLVDTLADYPHLGIDVEAGSFEAPSIDADVLAKAAKPKMDDLVGRSSFEARAELAHAWAAILLGRGTSADRACDIMRAFCPVRSRASWLTAHARDLVGCGCFYATVRLIASLDKSPHDSRDRVQALRAVCLRMLGDDEGAVRYAKRCAFEASGSRDARIVALLVLARLAPGELRARAADVLGEWAAPMAGKGHASLAWHDALLLAWNARAAGLGELGAMWSALHDAHADDGALCLTASWLFADAGEAWGGGAPMGSADLEAAERFVRARLADDGAPPAGFLLSSAGLSMESAHAKGMPYSDGPLPAAVLLGLRRAEMAILVQRRLFERGRHEDRVRRAALAPEGALYGGGGNVPPVERKSVPTLELKMFGRLDVAIGGVPLDSNRLARRQARVLLVLLVANRGRDISRDSVAQAMWPTRDLPNARKNFYTAWSQLRRALTLPDGRCPYLVRHQYGCHLDERYVRSDIARFDDICRELLFGKLNLDEWLEMYNEIDRDFSGELMPVEQGNLLVAQVRDERRSRLADALTAASQRLLEAGQAQWAIWFARSAVDREKTREDAYVALMRAQVAHDQRTAAMMTYLSCRRTLAEELGIDPSPEMTALYESLLGS